MSRAETERVLRGFERDLHHRGPDDHGRVMSRDGTAGLVNTRLAIIDLSAAGHQPMSASDGRYHIVFNGELYNYAALRADLIAKGYQFKGHSDTEVVLALYELQGSDCVCDFAGMFAFAIWDERDQSLFLARDHLGIKPLYYSMSGAEFVFASELRALLATGLVPRRLSEGGVAGYLMSGSVQEPETLIDGVRMLPAGHYLTWHGGEAKLTKYWEMRFGSTELGMGNLESGAAEAAKIVRMALEESVERHFVSDVPVGVFLSGGIDSTAIAALSAARGGGDIRTFSISFDDRELNEGHIAAQTAEHFGMHHTDRRLDAAAAKPLLHEFLAHADQPSVDGFNTFCVSKLASEAGLKVVLSGLGGDELFGGYQSFRFVPQLLKVSRALSMLAPIRNLAGTLAGKLPNSARAARLAEFATRMPVTANAYAAVRGVFTAGEVERLLPWYGLVRSQTPRWIPSHVPPQPSLADEISYLELTGYMRNQLLRDSDVMSMASSLELRVPFVDVRLVEAIRQIPSALRLARGKQLLVNAVPEIPAWVRERPKQGFVFPFQRWVTSEWHEVFDRIKTQAPVRIDNWYRAWCLYALNDFVARYVD